MADNKRMMNPDELLLVEESRGYKNEATRGVRGADFFVDDLADLEPSSNLTAKSAADPSATIPSIRQNQLSLMHVNLNPEKTVEDMWTNVSSVVRDLPDVDPMFDAKLRKIIGNVYEAGNYCEYLVGLYTVEKRPVLDFKRLCGDGFVMDSFYRSVKDNLRQQEGVVVAEEEEETEDGDDVFDCYSSDEEESVGPEDEKYLRPNGYLQLSYDQNLVKTWIDKINTRHVEDKNHMMGLMAHNATHEANLKIIIEKGGKDLIALCKKQLTSGKNAALVRNTSALIKQIVNVSKDWSLDCVEAMLEAMVWWVPDNGRKNETKTFEVTESREAVHNLVESLFVMKSNGVSVEDMMSTVKTFTADEESGVSKLVTYLESQTQSDASTFVLGLFPQTY